MRQLELMQPTAATSATVSNMVPSRPAAAIGAMGGASFSSTFRAVQHDVADFLAHGGGSGAAPSSSGGATNLSVEGMALLQRSGQGSIDSDSIDPQTRQQFLASIQPWAEETGQRLGVSPQVVAAHAALESGWGQHPLRAAGADSNNLFGLKAGGSWQGAVASAQTTEYQNGAALKKTERFRSYPDTATAFRDYADLLTSNPRYQSALNTGSDARAFARGLAQGGYATDPAYADKLSQLATQLMRSGSGSSAGAARLLNQSGD
jgi:flagellar protein FlgJ